MGSTGKLLWPTVVPPGDGVTDDTARIRAAFASAGGTSVLLQSGTYVVSGTTTPAAGATIVLDNCTFKAAAAIPGGVFGISNQGVTMWGKATHNMQGFAAPLYKGSAGGNGFGADLDITATNAPAVPALGNYLFQSAGCNDVEIGGYITTTGNSPLLVHVDGGARITVKDVHTPALTVSNGNFSPVQVCESTGTGSLSEVTVKDIDIDGGGVLGGAFPGVMVGTLTTTITTSHASLHNVKVKNTANLSDGVDIILAQHVTASDLVFDSTNQGLNASGCTDVKVANGTGTSCRAAAFAAGDSTVAFGTNLVTFDSVTAIGCNNSGAGSHQFLVYAPTANSTNVVRWRGALSFTEGVAQYDMAITGPGTVSVIDLEGGYFTGGTVGHIDDTIGGRNSASFVARDVRGLNPFGNLAGNTPVVPGSGVTITNNTGFDCYVTFFTGAAVTVSAITVHGTVTGYTLPVNGISPPIFVAAGETLQYTSAGGNPTWSWNAK